MLVSIENFTDTLPLDREVSRDSDPAAADAGTAARTDPAPLATAGSDARTSTDRSHPAADSSVPPRSSGSVRLQPDQQPST
jgi:hypothetical protein